MESCFLQLGFRDSAAAKIRSNHLRSSTLLCRLVFPLLGQRFETSCRQSNIERNQLRSLPFSALSLSLDLCLFVSVATCICQCLCDCVSFYLCVCLYVCLSLSVCFCPSVSVCVFVFVSICLSVCLSLSLFLHACLSVSYYLSMEMSIKYVTLFWTNFDRPSPCHTLAHISGPLRYVTYLGPPICSSTCLHTYVFTGGLS